MILVLTLLIYNLFKFNHTKVEGNRINGKNCLCFIASSFLDHGGVEEWLVRFRELVDTSKWEVMYYFWSVTNTERFHKTIPNSIISKDITSMMRFCNFVVATAYWRPSLDYNGRYVYVNHGSISSNWSMHFLLQNIGEEIISVSKDIPKNIPHRVLYTPLKSTKCNKTIKRDCSTQFLFIGRNSFQFTRKIK